MKVVAGQDHRALFAARNGRQLGPPAQGARGRVEIGGFKQRGQLDLIGQQHIDLAVDEAQQGVAMAVDHEGVRQGQGDQTPRGPRKASGLGEGAARLVRIEQIAFQIGDNGPLDQGGVHVRGLQQVGSAEEGRHSALAVGGHIDQAACGGRAADQGRHAIGHAGGADVMGEHLAQSVVRHFADIGRAAAQAGHARHRIGRRAARGLDARRHTAVQPLGLVLVDQHHAALGQTFVGQKVLGAGGDDVDNGVADGGDVVKCGHGNDLGAVGSGRSIP